MRRCDCTKINNWKTIVDINNKTLTCFQGQSYEIVLGNGMPPNYNYPIKIIPDPKCPSCIKYAYQCQKCKNQWGWTTSSNPNAAYSLGKNVQICRWSNGTIKPPIIIGWHREGDCAYAIFSCGNNTDHPFYKKDGRWTYNDGRKKIITTSDKIYIRDDGFNRFNNLPNSLETVEKYNIPARRFFRKINFSRPINANGGINSNDVPPITQYPFECRTLLCPPQNGYPKPLPGGRCDPTSQNSYPWLAEYERYGLPYQCTQAWAQSEQDVFYVWAKNTANVI
ncbi:MAG: hypothetical protein EBU90_13715 [Proteobacteria bacterium]|nr:hypothetical protein [Pseudomonadota bacterium]